MGWRSNGTRAPEKVLCVGAEEELSFREGGPQVGANSASTRTAPGWAGKGSRKSPPLTTLLEDQPSSACTIRETQGAAVTAPTQQFLLAWHQVCL